MNKYKSSIDGEFVSPEEAAANKDTTQKVGKRDVWKDAKKWLKKYPDTIESLEKQAGKRKFREIYLDYDGDQHWVKGFLVGGEVIYATLKYELEKI